MASLTWSGSSKRPRRQVSTSLLVPDHTSTPRRQAVASRDGCKGYEAFFERLLRTTWRPLISMRSLSLVDIDAVGI